MFQDCLKIFPTPYERGELVDDIIVKNSNKPYISR